MTYRNRIVIEKRILTIEKGIKKEEWKEFHKCWCEILDLYGQEKNTSFDTRLENTIKLKCRWCIKLDNLVLENTKDYRIKLKGKELDLMYVDSLKDSKKHMILQVKKFE